MDDGSKVCSRCGMRQPLENFHRKSSRKDGRRSQCKACRAAQPDPMQQERNRRWAIENPARKTAGRKAHYLANRDRYIERARQWKLDNPERVKASRQRVASVRRPLTAEQQALRNGWSRAWRKANPERVKQVRSTYYRNHRDRVDAGRLNRSEWLRNAPGTASYEQVQSRLAVFGRLCWICRGPAQAKDHVKPVSKGGTNWPANLRPICKSCNSRKRNRWLGVARLNELARTIRIERLNDALASLRTSP